MTRPINQLWMNKGPMNTRFQSNSILRQTISDKRLLTKINQNGTYQNAVTSFCMQMSEHA